MDTGGDNSGKKRQFDKGQNILDEDNIIRCIGEDEFGQSIKRKKKVLYPVGFHTISSSDDQFENKCENIIDESFSTDITLNAPCNSESILFDTTKRSSSDQFCELTEGMCPEDFNFSFLENDDANSDAQKYFPETFHGLPMTVKDCLKEYRGIEKLYDWQEKCLTLPGVLSGHNLIYSLPTSGGKTLVAELLILQQVLLKNKDAILILPYVSIVQEKVRELMPFAETLGFCVEEYASSKGRLPPVKRRKKHILYIATIEKSNALVNSLIEINRLNSIGLVVVDELHMLNEPTRGATLESCVSKLLFASDSVQLVGMSATISNLSELAQFMRADVYTDHFRPVELKEYIKLYKSIYSINRAAVSTELLTFRDISSDTNSKFDPDQVSILVQEVVPSASCLIFCATKKNCENVAIMLTKSLPKSLKNVKSTEREMTLKQLQIEATELCPILARTIPYGIAYHHSGLTSDEKYLIEDAYRRGILCVITCTSTLAAGVNLPASRVIIRSPYVGREFISNSQYQQMSGRAGRSGLCNTGESIVILRHEDKQKFLDILSYPCESCVSKLLCDNYQSLTSLFLSLIALRLINTSEDLIPFLQCTLLYHQHDVSSLLHISEEILSSLVTLNCICITVSPNERKFVITDMGRAVHKGCINVSLANAVYEELYNAQRNLVLTTDLHLLTLVVPFDLIKSITLNWTVFFNKVSNLPPEEFKVAEIFNIKINILTQKLHGLAHKMSDEETITYTKFYIGLILHSILKHNSNGIWNVADSFDCPRGLIQSIIQQCSSYSSCLVHFAEELPSLWAFNALLPLIVQKLSYAVCIDLLSLMEIPGIKQGRARQLFKLGIKSPQDLVCYTPRQLSDKVDHLFPEQARKIIKSAQFLLAEKAETLQDEAQELLDLVPDY